MKPQKTRVDATSAMVHIEPNVRARLDVLIYGTGLTYGQAIRAILKSWSEIDEVVRKAEKKGLIKNSTSNPMPKG